MMACGAAATKASTAGVTLRRAGGIGRLGLDRSIGLLGRVLGGGDQRRGTGTFFVEQAQARDADGGQVLGELVDLVAQVGADAVQQRRFGADFRRAVAHQRDPFLFEQARGHQVVDVAAAEEAGQDQRLALRQQLAGGDHGVLGSTAVVLAHQGEGVAVDAAGAVDAVEHQLHARRVGTALVGVESRHRCRPGRRRSPPPGTAWAAARAAPANAMRAIQLFAFIPALQLMRYSAWLIHTPGRGTARCGKRESVRARTVGFLVSNSRGWRPTRRPHEAIESPYAWMRLAVSLLLMTIGGSGMYSVTVVLPRIQAEFGVARADASLPYTADHDRLRPRRHPDGPAGGPLRRAGAGGARRRWAWAPASSPPGWRPTCGCSARRRAC